MLKTSFEKRTISGAELRSSRSFTLFCAREHTMRMEDDSPSNEQLLGYFSQLKAHLAEFQAISMYTPEEIAAAEAFVRAGGRDGDDEFVMIRADSVPQLLTAVARRFLWWEQHYGSFGHEPHATVQMALGMCWTFGRSHLENTRGNVVCVRLDHRVLQQCGACAEKAKGGLVSPAAMATFDCGRPPRMPFPLNL